MDEHTGTSPHKNRSQQMKVLVTGSTGFIGANLCLALASRGQQVHGLYRSESRAENIRHPNIKLFKGDILDVASIENAIQGCDQVYHTAAFTGIWARNPDDIYRLNVTATINVLNAALKSGCRNVVITSTAGVTGPSVSGPVTEDTTPTLPYFTEYERTKRVAEYEALEFVQKGLNIRLVNPTRVFGPGRLSQSNSVTKMITGYAKGSWRVLPGDGKSVGNYAFIDDVVRGHILAMEKGRSGERYILGGENLNYRDLFDTVAGVTGKRRLLIPLPLKAMLLASNAAMLGWKLAKIQPFITPGLVKKFNHHWLVSSQKALDELGYQITPFREAAKVTLEWSAV
jgi:nucleoside-diphosphate-sugar epimerase